MATYAISDIHGEYEKFLEILRKIRLKTDDRLYVLGDILDRGPHPVKTLLTLLEMPNAVCMAGNHELMALGCLEFLMQDISGISIEEVDRKRLENLVTWQYNGAKTTIDEFRALDRDMQCRIIDSIRGFSVYEKFAVNGRKFLLVHGGLGGFYRERPLEDYSLQELLWSRAEYDRQYFNDIYVVTGHTPTQCIKENPRPGYIYRQRNHIAIDCGCTLPGGRLAAICLDSGEEYYV